MQLVEVRNDCLRKVWIEQSGIAPSYILEDITIAVNQAIQLIWLAGPDHFRRADFTFNTVSGTASYTLDADVQEVLGPVRLDTATHLRPVDGRGDFDHYHTRFLGADSDEVSSAQPVAYFIDRRNTNADDNQAVSMLLTPTPDDTYSISFEASKTAPTYTTADLATTATLQVPHGYVESLFLPIARYFSIRSHFFGKEAIRQSIEADYQQALALYGMADAAPEPQQKGAA